MPDLHDLVDHAAPTPSAPLDVDALWRTGRRQRTGRRAIGVLGAVVLLGAGVGAVTTLGDPTVRLADGGAELPVAASPDGGVEGGTADAAAPTGDVATPLRIGALLPLTGDLAFYGPGLQAAVELAVEDLNAAGGVRGQPVELVVVDSADGSGATGAGGHAVDDLLAQEVSAVVGPVSGGPGTAESVQRLADAGVLVVSPSASGADFGRGSDGLVGRLSANVALQGLALAQVIADDGANRVAVVTRADDDGQDTAARLREGLDAIDVEIVVQVDYDQFTQSFAGPAAEVAAADPDTVVLLGYDESVALLTELAAHGVGPADLAVWSGEGLMADVLPAPAVGVRGVRWVAPDDSAFVARLRDARPEVTETGYAAAAYDAVLAMALGSAAADSVDGREIADRLAPLTQPGAEPCTSAASCLELIGAGSDLTYEGALGISALDADNQPAGATFEVFRVADDGSQPTIGTVEISTR